MKRAWAQVRHHRSRYGALLLAIMISVGFVTTALVFLETESAAVRKQLAAPASRADVVVDIAPSAEDAPAFDEVAQRLEQVPDAGAVAAVPRLFADVAG